MIVKRKMAAIFAGQAFTSLLALALVPTYIHYLTIEAYGLAGLFAVIQVWLSLLDLGMTPTLTREALVVAAPTFPGQLRYSGPAFGRTSSLNVTASVYEARCPEATDPAAQTSTGTVSAC